MWGAQHQSSDLRAVAVQTVQETEVCCHQLLLLCEVGTNCQHAIHHLQQQQSGKTASVHMQCMSRRRYDVLWQARESPRPAPTAKTPLLVGLYCCLPVRPLPKLSLDAVSVVRLPVSACAWICCCCFGTSWHQCCVVHDEKPCILSAWWCGRL